ncbi:hypothetical protein AXG93_3552s1000 [Marchantia polymorpha subsp. ruderalis]|uniref:Uncharacterized protein n=1 Tax=Marchantia polymorpha subsp. ruderalis TaxID=1480154 RepID=A0A176W9Q7_MARPO|nr:hypothetical protein AXG93_3552s1000 [Marchantia polymorpha subsp. ruderalis]
MSRKRKIETTAEIDEAKRSLDGSFRTVVTSVYSLYSLQKEQTYLAFEAGERHGLKKLKEWIIGDVRSGSTTSTDQLLQRLREKLARGGEMFPNSETSFPPQLALQPQHRQQQLQLQQRCQQPSPEQNITSTQLFPASATAAAGLPNFRREHVDCKAGFWRQILEHDDN